MDFTRSRELQRKAHELIPGGAHTYAKGDDQYPELSPGFIERGQGCRIWDVDGNEFIEYGMGLRAVTLGHAYMPVVKAAGRQMLYGANFNRPAALEIACAEKLLEFIPTGGMVKFAKDGSAVTTAAIKLARAHTGRDKIAICGDHPFFSYNDWFIGATGMPGGIPQLIKDMTVKFRYNDLASVQAMFEQHPGEIACIILEPTKTVEPADRFLHETMRICHEHGALFILDEMITGFRMHQYGGQGEYQIEPDISTWGKAMANGFALSALVGKREIMELGGLRHATERVFLLSTTHGAETHALAASIATMEVYQREDVIGHLYRVGERLQNGINQLIESYSLQGHFCLFGRPCNLVFATRDQEKKDSQGFRALFMQEMLKRGVLAPSLIVSYSHKDADIDQTLAAINGALSVYCRALEDGYEKYLVGQPVKPVYRRFN
jgi:glutamate-1-semialdehyde 2,1-aminomutase